VERQLSTPGRATPFATLLVALALAAATNAHTAMAQGAGHLIGKADAPVQVMEFGDFECPHCAAFARETEPEVRATLVKTGIVAFRYFDFPLPKFKNSMTAHLAASCAESQGKFWEMHDRLYGSQAEWNGDATSDPLSVMAKYAAELKLDVGAFRSCVSSQKFAARIQDNRAEGVRRGVTGTPTFILGKRTFHGVTFEQFKAIVDSAVAEGREKH
jgi:protein-disulfide isomerase